MQAIAKIVNEIQNKGRRLQMDILKTNMYMYVYINVRIWVGTYIFMYVRNKSTHKHK